ncbi:30S ribosomal protein S17 [Candidatus Roizmanbacteria bacterium]|nr:30S ribosomal protein S17 [Candidatus Roizmanbacteria bacterium]
MSKTIIGKVVSTKMQKTVLVEVERKFRHPLYKKVIVRGKKFKAHNEMEGIAEGDVVVITETRPVSKDVHFVVSKKLDTNTVS